MLKVSANIIINVMFLAGSGCVTVGTMKRSKEKMIDMKIYHEEPKGQAKAVVILLHGLNLVPSKMDDWAHILADHGAHVLRWPLYGHTGDPEHMRSVTAEDWRKQFKDIALLGEAKAKELSVPLYFFGFSLGALVALAWLAHEEHPAVEKMVLIAPAISVPWYSRALINALAVFGHGLILPSRSPAQYRANPGTSVAAYLALFALKDSLEASKYKNANVKTLILIDRHDELVNSQEIRDIIARFNLGQWNLEIVDNRFAYDNYGFRHLMVDQEAMGKELFD